MSIFKRRNKVVLTVAQQQRRKEIDLMDKRAREAGKQCPWQNGGYAR